jgi:hypothetical protein
LESVRRKNEIQTEKQPDDIPTNHAPVPVIESSEPSGNNPGANSSIVKSEKLIVSKGVSWKFIIWKSNGALPTMSSEKISGADESPPILTLPDPPKEFDGVIIELFAMLVGVMVGFETPDTV